MFPLQHNETMEEIGDFRHKASSGDRPRHQVVPTAQRHRSIPSLTKWKEGPHALSRRHVALARSSSSAPPGSQGQERGPARIHRVLCTAGSACFPRRSLLSGPSDGSWVRTQKPKATAPTHLGRSATARCAES